MSETPDKKPPRRCQFCNYQFFAKVEGVAEREAGWFTKHKAAHVAGTCALCSGVTEFAAGSVTATWADLPTKKAAATITDT